MKIGLLLDLVTLLFNSRITLHAKAISRKSGIERFTSVGTEENGGKRWNQKARGSTYDGQVLLVQPYSSINSLVTPESRLYSSGYCINFSRDAYISLVHWNWTRVSWFSLLQYRQTLLPAIFIVMRGRGLLKI
jgi:hypothetical protein